MKGRARDLVVTLAGAALAVLGLVLLKTYPDPTGVMRTLPYVCIGLGCGAFGHGMGNLLARRAMKSSPELQRRTEIERRDERNVALGNRAKAKAFDLMLFVFGALMVAFALMGVDVAAVLLLVAAYLFVVASGVYYRMKYDREM